MAVGGRSASRSSGVSGMFDRVMKSARHHRVFDQEIIDQQLPPVINGDDRRRLFQIGNPHGLGGGW
jgi:hypothetical protein